MAAKKKSKGGDSATKKALAGIEKAHKDLQLNIQSLKSALGGGRHDAPGGGRHNPGGGVHKPTGGVHKPTGGVHKPTGGVHQPGSSNVKGGRHTAS